MDIIKDAITSKEVTDETPIPLCPKCNTPKYVKQVFLGKLRLLPVMCKCRAEEVAKKELMAKQAEFQELVRSLRSNSLMDERFAESRFEKVVPTKGNEKALKTAKLYVQEIDKVIAENKGLMFTGGVGTGKTLIAACIANALIDKGYSVIMTSIVKMLDGGGWSKDEAYISKINKAQVLIIDDFGAERKTDYAFERAYDIIDSRYRVRKPLIITTNLTLAQMTRRGDVQTDRIYDRVLEMCSPVEITGVSWRMIAAKKKFERITKGEW